MYITLDTGLSFAIFRLKKVVISIGKEASSQIFLDALKSMDSAPIQFLESITMKYGKTVFHIILICAVSLLFCYAIFKNFNYWGIADWDQHLFYLESPIKVVKDYAQFPLWNPWYCGGMVLFQNSQVPFFTPFTLLYFLFDTPQAVKISILFHLIIAFIGMYLLAKKRFGIDHFFLILVPSSIFVFNSFISMQITVGHTWILAFAYIPFVFFFFEKYVENRDRLYLVFTALGSSMMIFEGGIYPAPLTALFLIVYSMFAWLTTSKKFYLLALFQIGILSFLISSIKLIPLFDYMAVYPRHAFPRVEIIPLSSLSEIFLGTRQNLNLSIFEGQTWGWQEYGCYIGVWLLILFSVSLVISMVKKSDRRKNIALILCLIFFFLLFLGEFHPYAPYSYLKKLPVFKSLHVTGRFLIIITFIASVLMLHLFRNIQNLTDKIQNTIPKFFITALIITGSLFIIYDLFRINSKPLKNAFTIDPDTISYFNDKSFNKNKYHLTNIKRLPLYGAHSSMYPGLKMNIASRQAYELHRPATGLVLKRPLVFSPDPKAEIKNIRFTPNKISFDLRIPKKNRIYLNQNYVRGWRFSIPGIEVKNDHHKPVVEIKRGDYKGVYFFYFPYSIYLGVIFSSVGVFLCILMIRFRFNLFT